MHTHWAMAQGCENEWSNLIRNCGCDAWFLLLSAIPEWICLQEWFSLQANKYQCPLTQWVKWNIWKEPMEGDSISKPTITANCLYLSNGLHSYITPVLRTFFGKRAHTDTTRAQGHPGTNWIMHNIITRQCSVCVCVCCTNECGKWRTVCWLHCQWVGLLCKTNKQIVIIEV